MADPSIPNTLPFKWVFIAIVVLMFVFIIGNFWISSLEEPTPAQTDLAKSFSDFTKMCLGAVLGLLGGRATDVRS